ncbi:MAG: sugar ABC transporter ATP-binding protein, partial [Verrucomicrobiae bacterium]|nr:sugar ABC transporter ATP-binding protein [Verrucomicrobiae bacterium]
MSTSSKTSDLALRFDGIVKAFFGVRVLKGISFELAPGKTLGLVGENGAGKSTLMNILGGNLAPDAGNLEFWGNPYQPRKPADAERAGIAFVHQELNLFENLSIAENLFIANFPVRGGLVDRKQIHQRTEEVLLEVGLAHSPAQTVESLSAGERQLVEIAKALVREARLIILDEPTTSLTDHEIAHLFSLLQRLKQQGITLIYISHVLGDVLKLADDILILRDGEVVGKGPADSFTQSRMVSLMVGRDIDHLFPPRTHRPGARRVLQVNGLTRRGVLKDVSLELKQGEVLGISGLMGSGRTELARALFGLDPVDAGEVLFEGESILSLDPAARIGLGMAFLTEDRRTEGLCPEASIEDNLALVSGRRFAKGFFRWIPEGDMGNEVDRYRDAVRLTPDARNDQAVRTLSGGNQQKVVLARWLQKNANILIFDEPTRGIDVGAKHEIYQLMNELTAAGKSIIMISSELPEVIGMSDRILVMHNGRVTGEVCQGPDVTQEKLMEL